MANRYSLIGAIICILSICSCVSAYYGDSVLLEGVKAVTFKKGQMTNARRVSPIPQVRCIGGSARSHTEYEPDVIQCTNVGNDGTGNVQWKCEAELDSNVRFGETTVNCEGYNYPDDPYILKGSCGLEYTLEFTNQGKQNQHYSRSGSYDYYATTPTYESSSHGFNWGTFIMFVVIGFIIYSIVKQYNQNSAAGYTSGQTGGNDFYGGGGPGNPGNSGYYPSAPPSCGPSTYPSTQTYTPGFWSGLGGGSMLGYLFGRATRPSYYSGFSYPARTYGPTWGHSYSSSHSSSPSYSRSSSTRTSSGFGSTTRR